jgi:hypothetical protein
MRGRRGRIRGGCGKNKIRKEGKKVKKVITLMLAGLLISLTECVPNVKSPEWPMRVKSGMPITGGGRPLGPVEIENGDPIHSQKTVALLNGVREAGLTRISQARVWADYRAWTDVIVERLEIELKKRAVRFGTLANHVFKVSITTITVDNAASQNATVYVSVERADGWVKNYKGYFPKRASPEIKKKITERGPIGCAPEKGALCWAVIFVVEEIIKDPDFREALK